VESIQSGVGGTYLPSSELGITNPGKKNPFTRKNGTLLGEGSRRKPFNIFKNTFPFF
jgi:hypothetical protein